MANKCHPDKVRHTNACSRNFVVAGKEPNQNPGSEALDQPFLAA